MSQACLDLRPLLAARPLGVLDPGETAALDAHLATCAACRTFTGHVDEALEASSAPAIAPASDAWDRLAARFAEGRAAHRVSLDLKIAVSCTFCHETLERKQAAFCASCLAPHHADCFEEHGRCSAPGCSETRTVEPRERSARPVRRRPPRIVLAVAAGLIGAVGMAAVTNYRRAERGAPPSLFWSLEGVWEGGDFGQVVVVGKTGYYNAPGTGVGRIDFETAGKDRFRARFMCSDNPRFGPMELAYVASTQTVEGTWRYDDDVPVQAKGPYELRWTRSTQGNRLIDHTRQEYLERFLQEREANQRLQEELARSEKERARLLARILDADDELGTTADRGFLGLAFVERNGQVFVDGVYPQSPADTGGVKFGDRIVLIDDGWVRTIAEVRNHLKPKARGDRVVFHLQRERWEGDVTVTLGERPKK